MLFIDNKYTRIYNSIIENAKGRLLPSSAYFEKHHIIPRSMGGNNSSANIVKLLAREHFLCHWLLIKMTEGKNKRSMANALRMMLAVNPDKHKGRYIPRSKIYAIVKSSANQASLGKPCSAETREKIRQGNLKRNPCSEETRKKLSDAAKRRKGFTPEGRARSIAANLGRKHSEETKEKLRQHNLGKTNWSQKGIPQERLTCTYCGLTGGKSAMKHWHFEKCRHK